MGCLLGLDIGGSRSRARLVIDGEPAGEASGPSASPVAAGLERARAALGGLLTDLARPCDAPPPDAVCAGAAGSDTPATRGWLQQTLTELTRSARVAVVPDAELVLPAAGHTQGLAVICGTGSIVCGREPGTAIRAGGWGYLLGDEGGGFALARGAVRTLLDRRDAARPAGPLGVALAVGAGGLDGLLAELYADPRPARWAALAPAVLDCPDPSVDDLLGDGARALAVTAATAAGRLTLSDGPIVVAGGLVEHARARAALVSALEDTLPAWRVEILRAPPVAGAVALAATMLRGVAR